MQCETRESNDGKIGAKGRLGGIRPKGSATGFSRETPFFPGKPRHDERSGDKHSDTQVAGPGFHVATQRQAGNQNYVDSQQDQQSSGRARRAALGVFGRITSKTPQHNHSRQEFDCAVAAEGEEGRTARSPGGPEGKGSLEAHPCDGECLEALDTTDNGWARDLDGSHQKIMTLDWLGGRGPRRGD